MKTNTTIVIGGRPEAPAITNEPEQIVARRASELEWRVENASGREQEIALINFSRTSGPQTGHPLEKDDRNRKARVDRNGVIHDRVRGNATPGTYKYEIWLNGVMAVDPEVVIREDV